MSVAPESLLERLLAVRSTSDRDSKDIVERVLELSGAHDDEITLQPYDRGRKANVLLRRGPPHPTGGLTLSGHLDVVPAEEDGWESDPWTLTEREDRWVGRGTCDMKGFVALALDRFRRLEGVELAAPLALLLTADEEVGSIGAQRWIAAHPPPAAVPRQVLIGEPTELCAVRMHKGHLRLRLELRGTAAHSGYPHRGHNAIEPAGRALVALSGLRVELANERSEHSEVFPEVPYVALNVGQITGGVATNIIPDRCILDLGLRLLPGMTTDSFERRVRGVLEKALQGEDWELRILNDSPPLLTADGAPLYSQLCELLGQDSDRGVSFASDGGTLGRCGFDCVLFGPGSIEAAHRANEFVPKDELEKAGEVLDELIERFCGARPV